jgi:WD40 repeat protein
VIGKLEREIPLHSHRIESMAISADGRMLVSGAETSQVSVFDLTAGREMARVTSMHPVRSVAISPDGTTVAAGGVLDGVEAVVLLRGGQTLVINSDELIRGVAFSPDGRIVASCGGDGQLRFWETAGGRLVRAYRSGNTSSWSTAFAPNGRSAVVCGEAGGVDLWDITVAQDGQTFFLPADVFVAVRPVLTKDSLVFARHTGPGRAALVSFNLARSAIEHEFGFEHGNRLCTLISPDGRMMVSRLRDNPGRIRIDSVRGGTLPRLLDIPRELTPDQARPEDFDLAFSPDGERLAVAFVGCGAAVWDLAGKGALPTYWACNAGAPIAFSPVGDELALFVDDRLTFWNPTTRGTRVYGPTHVRWSPGLILSSDGRLAAQITAYGNVLGAWDLATPGSEASDYSLPTRPTAAAISPDSRVLALGASDGSVALRDATTFERITTLSASRSRVVYLQFSAEGSMLVALAHDPDKPTGITVWATRSPDESMIPLRRIAP